MRVLRRASMPENLAAAPTATLHSFYFGSLPKSSTAAREKFFPCAKLQNETPTWSGCHPNNCGLAPPLGSESDNLCGAQNNEFCSMLSRAANRWLAAA